MTVIPLIAHRPIPMKSNVNVAECVGSEIVSVILNKAIPQTLSKTENN